MSAVVEAPPSRRIKELEVMVADVVVETPDTSTLVFFTGNDHLEYKAGHFLTIDPHQFEALERFTQFLEDLRGRRGPPRAGTRCARPRTGPPPPAGRRKNRAWGATQIPRRYCR